MAQVHRFDTLPSYSNNILPVAKIKHTIFIKRGESATRASTPFAKPDAGEKLAGTIYHGYWGIHSYATAAPDAAMTETVHCLVVVVAAAD